MNDHSSDFAVAPARLAVSSLVQRHGALQVFLLALVALLRPGERTVVPDLSALSDHLRRDIGLPAPPPQRRDWHHLR